MESSNSCCSILWAEKKVSAHVNSEFGPAGGRFGGGNYREEWMRMIDSMMAQSKFHKTIMSRGCRIHYGGLYTPPECPTSIKNDFLDGFRPVFSRLPLNHWKLKQIFSRFISVPLILNLPP